MREVGEQRTGESICLRLPDRTCTQDVPTRVRPIEMIIVNQVEAGDAGLRKEARDPSPQRTTTDDADAGFL